MEKRITVRIYPWHWDAMKKIAAHLRASKKAPKNPSASFIIRFCIDAAIDHVGR